MDKAPLWKRGVRGDLNSPEGKEKDRVRDGYMKDIGFESPQVF